jgi:hypothetical protein
LSHEEETMSRRHQRRAFGSIRKLSSGRYQAHYVAGGHRVTAPKTFAAKIDAECWLTDRRREIDLSLWNPQAASRPQHETFGEYATGWLVQRRTEGRPLKPRTVADYRYLLDTHLLPVWGQRALSSITAAEVKGWHANLLPGKPATRMLAYGLFHAGDANRAGRRVDQCRPVSGQGRRPCRGCPQGHPRQRGPTERHNGGHHPPSQSRCGACFLVCPASG